MKKTLILLAISFFLSSYRFGKADFDKAEAMKSSNVIPMVPTDEEEKNEKLTQKQKLKEHQEYLRNLSKYGKQQNKALKKRIHSFQPRGGKSGVKGVEGCMRDSAGNPVKRTKSYKK